MSTTKPKTEATKPATTTATVTAKAEPIVAIGDIDIPLPPKPGRAGIGKSKYPFADLAVNKFFSVKNKTRREMASAIANANKRYRSEFTAPGSTAPTVVQEREFYAVDVDADYATKLVGSTHEGASVLVIRSK